MLKEKIKVMSDAVGLFAHSSDSVLHEYLPEAWQELKAELDKPYTMTVEIPATVDGHCNPNCTFHINTEHLKFCHIGLDAESLKTRKSECKPSKGCPRFSND